MIIEEITSNIKDRQPANKKIDYIRLTYDQLLRRHQSLYSDTQKKINIYLSERYCLQEGDIVYEDEEFLYVIDLKEEDALVIQPKSSHQWGVSCYCIGNMHHPAYISDDTVIVPYDPLIESIIKKCQVEYKRETRKIHGRRINASAHEEHKHG